MHAKFALPCLNRRGGGVALILSPGIQRTVTWLLIAERFPPMSRYRQTAPLQNSLSSHIDDTDNLRDQELANRSGRYSGRSQNTTPASPLSANALCTSRLA